MKPLLEANHTSDTRTILYGVPQIPKHDPDDEFHVITQALAKQQPDLLYLQVDPMPYITRSRYMAHKCALNEVEDYDVKGVDDFNHPHPYQWEEAVVNLMTLDSIRAN